MMERLGNSFCNIYQIDPDSIPMDNKEVEWKVKNNIKRFPSMMAGDTSCNTVFSPDFRYFLGVDYIGAEFEIRSTFE